MQISNEIRKKIVRLCNYVENGTTKTGKEVSHSVKAWLDAQPAGELIPVENAQIDCACIAENCRHWLEVYRNNAGRISLRIHSKNGSSQAVSLPDNIRLYIHVPETTP